MSLTVKQLRNELSKFRDDAVCYGYEGEVCGIIVNSELGEPQGVIYCSEGELEAPRSDVPPNVAAHQE
jgi:hypothetical protein